MLFSFVLPPFLFKIIIFVGWNWPRGRGSEKYTCIFFTNLFFRSWQSATNSWWIGLYWNPFSAVDTSQMILRTWSSDNGRAETDTEDWLRHSEKSHNPLSALLELCLYSALLKHETTWPVYTENSHGLGLTPAFNLSSRSWRQIWMLKSLPLPKIDRRWVLH